MNNPRICRPVIKLDVIDIGTNAVLLSRYRKTRVYIIGLLVLANWLRFEPQPIRTVSYRLGPRSGSYHPQSNVFFDGNNTTIMWPTYRTVSIRSF